MRYILNYLIGFERKKISVEENENDSVSIHENASSQTYNFNLPQEDNINELNRLLQPNIDSSTAIATAIAICNRRFAEEANSDNPSNNNNRLLISRISMDSDTEVNFFFKLLVNFRILLFLKIF